MGDTGWADQDADDVLSRHDGWLCRARDSNTEKDIEHGPAETGRKRHDGIAKLGNCGIGDEITEGVAKSEDGIADSEDDSEGFENADNLAGDCGDPGDRHSEAEEA